MEFRSDLMPVGKHEKHPDCRCNHPKMSNSGVESHLSLAQASGLQCSGCLVCHDPTLWSPHRPLWGPLCGSHHTPWCGWTLGWLSSSPPVSSDGFSCLCQEVRCCNRRKGRSLRAFIHFDRPDKNWKHSSKINK